MRKKKKKKKTKTDNNKQKKNNDKKHEKKQNADSEIRRFVKDYMHVKLINNPAPKSNIPKTWLLL